VRGLTRGTITLLGVLIAGVLLWLGVEPLGESTGEAEYWWAVLLAALAGLAIALSQLLGGWTKWGWPRISVNVFVLAFLPALILGGWVLLYAQPEGGTLAGDVRDWTDDMGIDGGVSDLAAAWLAIAFGLGLIFGLTFDTTGPIVRRRDEPVAGAAAVDDRRTDTVEDDRRVRVTHGGTPVAPQPDRDDERRPSSQG
jgi:hypothetical protein